MKKIMVRQEHPADDMPSTLGELRQWIDNRIAMFGATANLEQDAGYNNICTYIVTQRLETDEEAAKRLKKDSSRQRSKRVYAACGRES